jgi:hypothetical protein
MNQCAIFAVVDRDVKAAREAYEHLTEFAVRMGATRFACGYIVQVEHTLDVEWYVVLAFDESQIAPGVGYLRQIQNHTVSDPCRRELISVFQGTLTLPSAQNEAAGGNKCSHNIL